MFINFSTVPIIYQLILGFKFWILSFAPWHSHFIWNEVHKSISEKLSDGSCCQDILISNTGHQKKIWLLYIYFDKIRGYNTVVFKSTDGPSPYFQHRRKIYFPWIQKHQHLKKNYIWVIVRCKIGKKKIYNHRRDRDYCW